MDWSDTELQTDLADVAESLGREPRQPQFVIPANRFIQIRAKEKLKKSRRGIKALIKPENARCVIPHLPAPGEHTHAILRGDFVLCDLIPTILNERGHGLDLHVATLGLSPANAEMLVSLKKAGRISSITVLCSHYFQQVDKVTTYREVAAKLEAHGRLIVARNHAKVICLPLKSGDAFVIAGSANLRSSDNCEQITIFNDPDLVSFYRTWIEDMSTAP